jgi:hypothetical protein
MKRSAFQPEFRQVLWSVLPAAHGADSARQNSIRAKLIIGYALEGSLVGEKKKSGRWGDRPLGGPTFYCALIRGATRPAAENERGSPKLYSGPQRRSPNACPLCRKHCFARIAQPVQFSGTEVLAELPYS